LNGSTKTAGLVALALVASLPGRLSAQGVLDQFTSENLAATAVGLDVGVLAGSNIRGTKTVAVRVDCGTIAPSIRVLLGASYFRADLSGAALQRFEQRLRGVVIDPTGDDTIRLGGITWSDVTGDLDFQYVMPQGHAATAYLGLGFSVHARHGGGAAIDGTFVQDALSAITAGLNGTLGAEFGSGHWRFSLEGRGVLASGLSTLGLSAGGRYRWAIKR
jgi:hypothetical protein